MGIAAKNALLGVILISISSSVFAMELNMFLMNEENNRFIYNGEMNLKLVCEVSGVVTNDLLFIIQFGNEVIYNKQGAISQFSDRFEISTTGLNYSRVITIKTVNINTTGIYYCTVIYNRNISHSHYFELLTVNETSPGCWPGETRILNRGDPITLSCFFKDLQDLLISSWLKVSPNGSIENLTSEEITLGFKKKRTVNIESLQLTDDGSLFRCDIMSKHSTSHPLFSCEIGPILVKNLIQTITMSYNRTPQTDDNTVTHRPPSKHLPTSSLPQRTEGTNEPHQGNVTHPDITTNTTTSQSTGTASYVSVFTISPRVTNTTSSTSVSQSIQSTVQTSSTATPNVNRTTEDQGSKVMTSTYNYTTTNPTITNTGSKVATSQPVTKYEESTSSNTDRIYSKGTNLTVSTVTPTESKVMTSTTKTETPDAVSDIVHSTTATTTEEREHVNANETLGNSLQVMTSEGMSTALSGKLDSTSVFPETEKPHLNTIGMLLYYIIPLLVVIILLLLILPLICICSRRKEERSNNNNIPVTSSGTLAGGSPHPANSYETSIDPIEQGPSNGHHSNGHQSKTHLVHEDGGRSIKRVYDDPTNTWIQSTHL